VPDFKPEQLLLLAGFLLPGAISMYVYGLLVPQKEFKLQERMIEALCFSLLNFIVVYVPLREVYPLDGLGSGSLSAALRIPLLQWLALVAAFIALPALWPVFLVRGLRLAERHGWVAVQAKTAWDDFFGRQREGFWIQVEMNDGTCLGGRFGRRSYASAYPEPGHLFVEDLSAIDDQRRFVEQWPGKAGVLLRPTDYKLVRVFVESSA
jgi:hypothetical protein